MNGNGIGLPLKIRRNGTPCVAPANTIAPVVSGLLQVGDTLTTTDGTWTGTAPIAYTYQWKRDAVSIGGATANTYVIVDADLGQDITCEVTGTNACGSATGISNTLVPEYAPMAQAWFDEYLIQVGNALPDAYKIIYNDLFRNLQGVGAMGSDDCFTAYKIIKGSPGYYAGSGSKWPLLSDLVVPTNTAMTEINGGGSYVQIGADSNVYTRQAAALKAWNTQETPSSHAYLTTSSAAYGSWILTTVGANSLYLIGCSNLAGTGEVSLAPNFNGTQGAFAIHDATYFLPTTNGTKGYYEMHRTAASGAGCVEGFRDGVSIGTGNVASVLVPDKQLICCGFSPDNGTTLTQTVSGGATPNDGLVTFVDRSAWTTAIGQQFYNSFVQFYTDLGITL